MFRSADDIDGTQLFEQLPTLRRPMRAGRTGVRLVPMPGIPLSTHDIPLGEIAGYALMIVSELGVSTRPIPNRGELTIGRAPDATVRLDGAQVSRRHAVLHMRGNSFAIEDLGSANGTVLHNQRLAAGKEVEIAPGDAIHVGDFVLIVRAFRAGDETLGGAFAAAGPGGDGVLPDEVILRSPAVLASFDEVRQAARSDINVLLLGETGVGKDVLARCVHHISARRDRPFLRLNCAALTESLLESELFGHEKGAFTGAVAAKPGLFESASGGTVFLDEIAEFPLALQPKLLQVIETREVLRVGSVRPISVDVRFVAATNRDLEAESGVGRFRGDLYYRLSGFSVVIPPLRERPEDVLPLADGFVRRMALRTGLERPPLIEGDVAALLMSYSWPGNVRELKNVIERAMVLAHGGPITAAHIRLAAPRPGAALAQRAPSEVPDAAPAIDLSDEEAAERRRIIDALVRSNGNQSQAARALGISRSTLLNRLDAYRISRPRKRPTRPV
jgi:DNA-binding NtrC family response regulator